ncbi:hypothetical protein L6J37_15640 [Photobacterium sp. WH77]|uniref:hypothetical protein n=1 Tax=unclassified Photobacterium TaxID=2628852 RepID=UPI001EDB4614|nr:MULTISPECIES: hypothetical protein [unclassified Photobacterium]MCG2838266.1 hypothetical protein [Photobacterium sp. WH77]MCG2845883.1 hypothetical protein [Photobacterium sp. WH80]
MSRSLCKYRRSEISEKIASIAELVSAPQYFCRSCARVANGKSSLCKPGRLPVQGQKRVPATIPSVTAASVMAPSPVSGQEPALPPVGERLESGAMVGVPVGLLSVSVKKLDKKLRKLAKKKRKRLKKTDKYLKKAEKYRNKSEQIQRKFDKLIYKASA